MQINFNTIITLVPWFFIFFILLFIDVQDISSGRELWLRTWKRHVVTTVVILFASNHMIAY